MDAAEQRPGIPGRGAWTRLGAAFAAVGAGATAVVIGGLLINGLPGIVPSTSSAPGSVPTTTSAQATSTAPRGFPLPPPKAVVFGGEAGRSVLALAVNPGKRSIGVQASIVQRNPGELRQATVVFDVRGAGGQHAVAKGTSCGANCFHATIAIRRPERVSIRLTGKEPLVPGAAKPKFVWVKHQVTFAMPSMWPPPPADKLLTRAEAVWRGLRTLTSTERLGDGHYVLPADYTWVAPNREAIVSRIGGDVTIIGNRGWVKPPASRSQPNPAWIAQPQFPIKQPVPYWQSASHAYVLGSVTYKGRPAWKVSFFDGPGGPAWFTVLIDKQTLHTEHIWMTARAHFMYETYTSFNAPVSITPPK